MFGSDTLEAAIGLVFVYLLFSVFCSALNEWILGHLLGLRSKTLGKAVTRLLSNPNLKQDFFELPLMRSLAQTDDQDKAGPSYLANNTFVDALLSLVADKVGALPGVDGKLVDRPDDTPRKLVLADIGTDLWQLRTAVAHMAEGELRHTLESLLRTVHDIDGARHKLSAWFDEGMDRASGWYKRSAHLCTAILALGTAAAFNLDTFEITRELMNNSRLRATLVAAATKAVENPPPFLTPTNGVAPAPSPDADPLATISRQITEFELPVGWDRPVDNVPQKIGGLLVTACALSMGAPFWFDLLGRLIQLRATGTKPARKKNSN